MCDYFTDQQGGFKDDIVKLNIFLLKQDKHYPIFGKDGPDLIQNYFCMYVEKYTMICVWAISLKL